MNTLKRDMLAQKLLVGIPDKKYIPNVIKLIKDYHIGGIILYKNNYNSINEMVDLINRLKEANRGYDIPLTIAIDQEGGRVNRLPKELLNIKSSYRQCRSGKTIVKKAARITSEVLSSLGINMDFAPVLDLRKQRDDNAFIGNRAFSPIAKKVIECGKIWCDELSRNNVIPVIKHYPGHGSLNVDSHLFLPVINEFKEDKDDLVPFKYFIKEETPAMMVAHILIRGKTGLKPATLSKPFISEYIRKGKKYNGLIVTDELGMKAVRIFYGKINSVKLAYEATNDIICIKYHPNYVEKSLKMLLKDNKISEKELENSFNKIIKYKKEYKFNDKEVSNKIDISKTNKMIEEINNYEEL